MQFLRAVPINISYFHFRSKIPKSSLPLLWIIFSQILWRLNCHDKSLTERSDGMIESPEVTLLYADILGTKRAFEKRVPECISSLSGLIKSSRTFLERSKGKTRTKGMIL